MSRQLRSRKRLFNSSQPPSEDGEVSPYKKMMVTSFKVAILDLPERILHQILSHTDLIQLGTLSQVCKQIKTSIITFLHTKYSIPVLFPCMTTPAANQGLVMYFIAGAPLA